MPEISGGAPHPRALAPASRKALWDWLAPGQVLELTTGGGQQGPVASASVVAQLVVRAQAAGEPVAWVEGEARLFPPDLAAAGVDLDALVVVRPPPEAPRSPGSARQGGARGATRAAGRSAAEQAVRASEVLLRSGAFGLIVLDLTREVPRGALGWLAKLHGLLRLHGARLVVLTDTAEEAGSLGPLVSLRVVPRCRRLSADRWVIEHAVLKSKLGQQVRISPEVRSAPEGAAAVSPGPALSKVEHGTSQERCA